MPYSYSPQSAVKTIGTRPCRSEPEPDGEEPNQEESEEGSLLMASDEDLDEDDEEPESTTKKTNSICPVPPAPCSTASKPREVGEACYTICRILYIVF